MVVDEDITLGVAASLFARLHTMIRGTGKWLGIGNTVHEILIHD
jgi:hypothetical protein